MKNRRRRRFCLASQQKPGASANFASPRNRSPVRPPTLRRLATETRCVRQLCVSSGQKHGASPFDIHALRLLEFRLLMMESRSNTPKAVVLMSGGMDSCVTAAIAAQNYRLAALHASYGQRTEQRELQSFHALSEHFRVAERLAVRLDYFSDIGGSSLLDAGMEIREAGLASREIP